MRTIFKKERPPNKSDSERKTHPLPGVISRTRKKQRSIPTFSSPTWTPLARRSMCLEVLIKLMLHVPSSMSPFQDLMKEPINIFRCHTFWRIWKTNIFFNYYLLRIYFPPSNLSSPLMGGVLGHWQFWNLEIEIGINSDFFLGGGYIFMAHSPFFV